jgi:predicted aminopeptidase
MADRWRRLISLALIVGWCGGCQTFEWQYARHAVIGELSILVRIEPIDEVLASGDLPAEEAAKLQLVVDARRFAIDHMDLNGEDAYVTFYDTHGRPLAFNVSAARREALQAKTWTFPIIGQVPYLGFFDREWAEDYAAELMGGGWDVWMYELDAYSTLGLLPNPVRSPMLRRDEISLAEVIIHELLHNTVWRRNDTTFNESLATYVGRAGSIDFLADHFGADAPIVTQARQRFEDVDRVEAFLSELYAELATFYDQPISSQEKIEGREAIFAAARQHFADDVLPTLHDSARYETLSNLPTNNAWVLARHRYSLDLDVFAAVHAATGESWPATIAVYQLATYADDPMQYLRDWLPDGE